MPKETLHNYNESPIVLDDFTNLMWKTTIWIDYLETKL